MTVRKVFGYRIFLVPGSYVDFYVLWSAQGGFCGCGDDGRHPVAMGLVMVTGFGPVLAVLAVLAKT